MGHGPPEYWSSRLKIAALYPLLDCSVLKFDTIVNNETEKRRGPVLYRQNVTMQHLVRASIPLISYCPWTLRVRCSVAS